MVCLAARCAWWCPEQAFTHCFPLLTCGPLCSYPQDMVRMNVLKAGRQQLLIGNSTLIDVDILEGGEWRTCLKHKG